MERGARAEEGLSSPSLPRQGTPQREAHHQEGLFSYSVLQLLQKIKQVNFTLYKSRISFDANGDICKGYDIITWDWSSPSWAFNVIGTFRVNPDRLSIDQGKIPWHTKDRQVPFCIQILFIAYC